MRPPARHICDHRTQVGRCLYQTTTPVQRALELPTPNFLFIGPAKTGSSWLYEYLRQHEQCYVPECKDIYFFDRYYDKGWDWYRQFFNDAPSDVRAIGELSHDYILSSLTAERIKTDLPGVRLITSLRNPVERSFSHYLYLVRNGITKKPFTDALKDHPEIIRDSNYATLLEPYYDRFPVERLLCLRFEELRNNSQLYADRVCDFLGLDHHTTEGLGIVRPASKPRSPLAARAMNIGANLVRNIGFPQVVGVIKHSQLTQWLYKPYAEDDKPRMNDSERDLLWGKLQKGVERLEGMTGMDFAEWRRY